jgi:hypothetical protein
MKPVLTVLSLSGRDDVDQMRVGKFVEEILAGGVGLIK